MIKKINKKTQKLRNKKYLITIFILILLSQSVGNIIRLSKAVDPVPNKTWDGDGGDGLWSTAANWSDDVKPVSTDDVLIDTTVTVEVDENIGFASLRLGNAGGTTSPVLNLTNNITAGTRDIIIENSATLKQNNATQQTVGYLTVRSGGLLTHSANSTTGAGVQYKIDFSASNIDVQAGGSVNVDGKGYAGGVVSPGQGTAPGIGAGGGYGSSGGAHAGNGGGAAGQGEGGRYLATTGYCDVSNPETIGSGGGNIWDGGPGGAGGGLVKLTTSGAFTLNGPVTARGNAGTGDLSGGGGGGAINISANTIAGSSTFNVSGGAGGSTDGGGGGGCALVNYTTSSSLDPVTSFSASGGAGGWQKGGFGQIMIKQVGSDGNLYVNGDGNANAGTTQGTANFTLNSITLTGTAVNYNIPSGKNLTLTAVSPFLGTGILSVYGALITSATDTYNNLDVEIFSGGTLTNLAASPLHVAGGTLQMRSGSTLTNDIDTITVDSGATLTLGPSATIGGTISTINSSGTLNLYRSAINSNLDGATTDVTIGGGTTSLYEYTSVNAFEVNTVTINSGGVLTHGANPATDTPVNVLNISANSFDVQLGGSINVDGKGYVGGSAADGRGPAPGQGDSSGYGASAGAHCGNGGSGTTFTSQTVAYDDSSNPVDMGSGGGNVFSGTGGAGGGLIKLTIVGSLTINGDIYARGYSSGAGLVINDQSAGGGGGAVNISAASVLGSPTNFSAAGGPGGSYSGGGGGGCVHITYASLAQDVQDAINVAGGAAGSLDGGAGLIGATSFVQTNVAPTVTDGNISIAGATGTGGAYKINDTVTVTWDNSVATGDGNTDIASATADFSQFGGGAAVAMTDTTACSGTNGDDIYEACYTIVAGAIDATNRNVSVTANDTGLLSTTTADATNATVDNIAPTVTAAKISVTGATGTGGVFKSGDTPVLTWNNTGAGDNNSDTISAVSFNAANFKAGDTARAGSNSSGTWTASLSGAMDTQDDANNNITVLVTDNAGNQTSRTGTNNYSIDTTAPVLAEVTPVSNGTDTTPDYTFSSTEIGDVTYGGDCTSATASAASGSNAITFTTLAVGTHSNCTITVTDSVGNLSNVLAVTSFTISAPVSEGGGVVILPLVQMNKPIEPVAVFTDIAGHWAEQYIKKLQQKCDVQGFKDKDGNLLNEYRPNLPISRAEYVKMFMQCKYAGLANPEVDPFTDVPKAEWYAPAIARAKTQRIVDGYQNGTIFLPFQSVNRAEATKMVLLLNYLEDQIVGGINNFTDVPEAAWFTKYINFGVIRGVISGYVDNSGNPLYLFGPFNPLTRAEAAKVITNSL